MCLLRTATEALLLKYCYSHSHSYSYSYSHSSYSYSSYSYSYSSYLLLLLLLLPCLTMPRLALPVHSDCRGGGCPPPPATDSQPLATYHLLVPPSDSA
jgi:hypothetical protein